MRHQRREATLGDLAARFAQLGILAAPFRAPKDRRFSGVAILEQPVGPGDLYLMLPDVHGDAAHHASRAAAAGASGVCAERSLGLKIGSSVLEVTDERRALAAAGALLAGDPARHLDLVGITGTNGKSTTAAMITRCLELAGEDTGLLGSFMYWAGDTTTYSVTTPRHGQAHLTTPDGPALHAALADMVTAGTRTAVMEVTSQALLHHRVDDCRFSMAALTRMGSDHLNLHGTPHHYHEAKRALFELLEPGAPIVATATDPLVGEVLGRFVTSAVLVNGDGVDDDLVRVGTQLRVGRRAAEALGTSPGNLRLALPVPAPHDLENAALAACCALAAGAPVEAIEESMATYPGLPRRLQPIATGPFLVIDSMLNDPVLDHALGPTLTALSPPQPLTALVGPRASRGPDLNEEFGTQLGAELAGHGFSRVTVTRGADVLPDHELVTDEVLDAFVGGLRLNGLAPVVAPTTTQAVELGVAAVASGGTLVLLGSEAVNPAGELLHTHLGERGFDGWLAGTRQQQVRRCVDPRGRLGPVGSPS
ncbi:MAG: Mur ligase family protein [Microthrixaceae bacterium]